MVDMTDSVIAIIGQTAARHNLRVAFDDCVDVCMTDVHAEQPSVNALSEHGLTVTFAGCVVCKAQQEQFPAQQVSGLPPPPCLLGGKLFLLGLAYYTTSRSHCQPMLT